MGHLAARFSTLYAALDLKNASWPQSRESKMMVINAPCDPAPTTSFFVLVCLFVVLGGLLAAPCSKKDVILCETRYTLDIPVDVSALVKQSSTTIPILVMFTKDPDAANSIVSHATTQRNIKLLAVALADESTTPTSQLQVIERLIQDAMVEVRFPTIIMNSSACHTTGGQGRPLCFATVSFYS